MVFVYHYYVFLAQSFPFLDGGGCFEWTLGMLRSLLPMGLIASAWENKGRERYTKLLLRLT